MGETFKPEGIATVKVTLGKSMGQLQLFVVDTPGPLLFRRDGINHLNLLELSNVLKVDSQPELKKQDQLNMKTAEYKDVFDYNIGKLKYFKLKLHLKDDAHSKFCRPHQVPYALKEKANTELDRLGSEGIVTKVNHSDWATPVVKESGVVCICGGFKSTIN